MKRICFISGGLGLLLLVATVFAEDKKQPTLAEANATIQELSKQIDSLQAKMKDVEQRLTKLEKAPKPALTPLSGVPGIMLPQVVVPRATVRPEGIENSFADPNHPPKIWGEGEINGWKFYTIPLSATERGMAEPIPVAGR